MTMVEFTIPGKPMGKGRRIRTRSGHTYMPERTVEYTNLVKMEYQETCGEVYLEGALGAQVMMYMPIPKAMPKYKRRMIDEGLIWPTKKPDTDNCYKMVTDALNTIAFHDDKQVCIEHVEKHYSDRPRVEVTLEELE